MTRNLWGDQLCPWAIELKRESNELCSFLQFFYGWELRNCPEAKKEQVFIAGVTCEGREVAVDTDSWSWIANGMLPQDAFVDADELATVWRRYLVRFPTKKYIVTARVSEDFPYLLSWEVFTTKKEMQKHITQLKKRADANVIRAYPSKHYAFGDKRGFYLEYIRTSPKKWVEGWSYKVAA